MGARDLFLSLNGRIGRVRWWIGTIAVAAAQVVPELMLGAPIAGEPATFRLRLVAFAVGASGSVSERGDIGEAAARPQLPK
jgi:uncharacterized membrane protein YhaH (DUF805 family)